MQKKEIRADILSQRNCLSEPDISGKSNEITKNLLSLPFLDEAKTVMVYSHFGSEPETKQIIDKLLRNGKQVVLPATLVEQKEIIALYIDSDTKLLENRYGIMEPLPTEEKTAKPEEIDVVIVPGVAFDEQGNRIGFGHRYYDKFLSGFKPRTIKIALAFELQIVEPFKAEAHDIPVDLIVTEERVIECKAQL